ncbi:hypothetical protein GGI20_004461 [Coemansia sp. BCRC 34301]|nr:hypothetical protein GGI20_004461 [Coemansia sp. BCRC 34301]
MPARSKHIRYTFAGTSFRQARTAQQPVYAWKKVWTSPSVPAAADEGAYTASHKLFKWVKTGQTVVHEDEDEVIAAAATADPVVPAPEEEGEGEDEHMPLAVLAPAAEEEDIIVVDDNVGQDTDLPPPPPPAESVGESADSAVEAAAAAVEKVAAATYSAHAIGNIIAAMDSPSAVRDDMSVDGDNSGPATPSADISAPSLPESLAPPAADNSAVDTASDNHAFA